MSAALQLHFDEQNLTSWSAFREHLLKKGHPEWAIVSVDFNAFEMSTWAQCCINTPDVGFSDLAEVINNPARCPHVEMGTAIEGHDIDSDDWKVRFAFGYELKKKEPKLYKALRSLAKGPNFGLPGGMGAERLMDYCRVGYGVELTLERAQHICKVWRRLYREAQPYLDYISQVVLGGRRGAKGEIVQWNSGRVRGGVGFCDAANGYFQGLAADAAKAAGIALAYEAYNVESSVFYGARPLAFVHDEFLYAVRRYRLHEAAHRMRDIMVAAAQPYCPDVRVSAEPAAFYRWSKAAGDPVYLKDRKVLTSYVEGAELIPFEEQCLYKEAA